MRFLILLLVNTRTLVLWKIHRDKSKRIKIWNWQLEY